MKHAFSENFEDMKEDNEKRTVEGICLRVFGAITASVTHEIKNTLSIINENAGLLEDLCLLSSEDAVPAENIDSAVKMQMRQVAKSNTIMTNLNQFAHAGDKVPGKAELQDVLALMEALTSRFAAMRKIEVNVSCPQRIPVQTNLQVLDSLIFVTLQRLYAACSEDRVLEIVGGMDEKQRVSIKFIQGENHVFDTLQYPGPEEQILAEEIGASCRTQDSGIIIELEI